MESTALAFLSRSAEESDVLLLQTLPSGIWNAAPLVLALVNLDFDE